MISLLVKALTILIRLSQNMYPQINLWNWESNYVATAKFATGSPGCISLLATDLWGTLEVVKECVLARLDSLFLFPVVAKLLCSRRGKGLTEDALAAEKIIRLVITDQSPASQSRKYIAPCCMIHAYLTSCHK